MMPHEVKSGMWTWLIVVVVLAVAGLAAVSFVTWFATRPAEKAWNLYYEELRAAGEPLTLADIERRRPTVDAGENAADFIRQLEPELEAIKAEDLTSILCFSDDLRTPDFTVGVPADVLARSRAFLEAHGDILTAAAPLDHLSRGRSSTNFAAVADDPFDAMLPNIASWRQLARLFQLRATIALVDGNIESAVHSFRCMISIGSSVEHEPNLIPRLVQVAIHRAALDTLGAILNAGALDRDTLDECLKIVEVARDTPNLRSAIELERAVFILTCDNLVAGRWDWSQVSDDGKRAPPPRDIRTDELIGCRIYESLLSVMDKPNVLLERFGRVETDALGMAGPEPYIDGKHRLLELLGPTFVHAVEFYVRLLAQVRCGHLAILAARYRLDHGSLPASLADLDASQDDLLVDPFDGKPLRFHVEDDAIVIYSIGPDLIDNDGTIHPAPGATNAPDVGFRLYSSPRPIRILPSRDED